MKRFLLAFLSILGVTVQAQFTDGVPKHWEFTLVQAFTNTFAQITGRPVGATSFRFHTVANSEAPWREETYRLSCELGEISVGNKTRQLRGFSVRHLPDERRSTAPIPVTKTTNEVWSLGTNYLQKLGISLNPDLRVRPLEPPLRSGVWSFFVERYVGNYRLNFELLYMSIEDRSGNFLGISNNLTTKDYQRDWKPKASVVDARVNAKDYLQKFYDRSFDSSKYERVTANVAGTPELVIDIPQKYKDRLESSQHSQEFRKKPLEPRLVYIVGVTNNNAWHKGQSVYTALPGSWVCVDAETGIVIGNH